MQSLTRAMDILEHMRSLDKSCSVAELVQRSSLPPSTVHRILQTFCKGNYVIRDEKTHLYHLGPALIPLGIAATRRLNLKESAHPVLKSLMRATEEDAFLIIMSDYKGMVVDKVEGPNNLKVVERYGAEMDMHCGAIRKSLLAFQSDKFIKEYIEYGLSRYTESTIVDPEALRANLREIRAKGVAVSRGEYVDDALGVGAPIFDWNYRVVASIGIIAPLTEKSKEQIPFFMKEVKKHAAELSLMLGNEKTQ